MPGKPSSQSYDEAADKGPVKSGEIFILQHGSGAYYAGQFPRTQGDGFSLEAGVAASAKAVQGRIVSQRPVTVLGHAGRDAQVVYTEKGDSITSFSRMISTPRRVFFLQYIAFGDHFTAPPAEFRFFLDSFRLTETVGSAT
jgi:hypothetical protein